MYLVGCGLWTDGKASTTYQLLLRVTVLFSPVVCTLTCRTSSRRGSRGCNFVFRSLSREKTGDVTMFAHRRRLAGLALSGAILVCTSCVLGPEVSPTPVSFVAAADPAEENASPRASPGRGRREGVVNGEGEGSERGAVGAGARRRVLATKDGADDGVAEDAGNGEASRRSGAAEGEGKKRSPLKKLGLTALVIAAVAAAGYFIFSRVRGGDGGNEGGGGGGGGGRAQARSGNFNGQGS